MSKSQFYVAGDGPQGNYWRGEGVCEVNEQGQYTHYPDWPERTLFPYWSPFHGESLEDLIKSGKWQYMIPETLRLPSGV